MSATVRTLAVLERLSEGPASRRELVEIAGRDERTLRRYLAALRQSGYGIERIGADTYVLTRWPLFERWR
jgi:DNA-binding IclR family transcriptional regulator